MSHRVTTLGRAEVAGAAGPVAAATARPAIVACLAHVAVEGACSREALGRLLRAGVPAADPAAAADLLLATVTEALGRDGLVDDGTTLRLAPDVRVDAVEFLEAVAGGELGRALELYGGDFLSGFASGSADFDAWAARTAHRLRRMYRAARGAWAQEQVRRGLREEALARARAWVDADPADKDARRLLVELERPETPPVSTTPRSGPAPVPPRPTVVSGPRLIRLVEGEIEEEVYPLAPGGALIGRDQGDLTFPHDPLVASLHASIRPRPPDPGGGATGARFVLRDEGSGSGVYVRFRGSRPVRPGDMWAAGQQLFRLEGDEPDG